MASRIDYQHLTAVLLRWQKLQGHKVDSPRQAFSWDSADQLSESAGKLDEYAKKHFNEALAKSDNQLTPLRDPLALNLGKHRWLSEDTEESYSDWLAWILQGMPHAAEIFPLFGNSGTEVARHLAQWENIKREEVNEQGRTDIILRFGKRGWLLIEVKTKPVDREELRRQLRRYTEWASKRLGPIDKGFFVLIALEEPEVEISPFQFVSWNLLCKRLRRFARTVKQSDLMKAALILAFCGAVEQNLLGISLPPARFRAMAAVDYLSTWMDAE